MSCGLFKSSSSATALPVSLRLEVLLRPLSLRNTMSNGVKGHGPYGPSANQGHVQERAWLSHLATTGPACHGAFEVTTPYAQGPGHGHFRDCRNPPPRSRQRPEQLRRRLLEAGSPHQRMQCVRLVSPLDF